MNGDFGTFLIKSMEFFRGLEKLLIGAPGQVGIVTFIGYLLIAQALMRAWQMSDSSGGPAQGKGFGYVLAPVIIGGMFLSWDNTAQMAAESLALTGGGIAYVPQAAAQAGYSQQLFEAVMQAVKVFGMFSIARGLWKFKMAGEGDRGGQEDPVWGGLWHILGGGIAMNMPQFLALLGIQ